MKRFYKKVSVLAEGSGFQVYLDSRGIVTPLKKPLIAATVELADAIAAEWEGQGEIIKPDTMPLTQLLNTQIDKIEGSDKTAMTERLAEYAGSDPLCYFAPTPADLTARQEKTWKPLIEWAKKSAHMPLIMTVSATHQPQPETVRKQALALMNAFSAPMLTAFQAAVGVCGSFVAALAMIQGHISPEEAYKAALLEELYQAEKWGGDPEAERRRKAIHDELEAVHRFLTLSRQNPSLQD